MDRNTNIFVYQQYANSVLMTKNIRGNVTSPNARCCAEQYISFRLDQFTRGDPCIFQEAV